MENKLGIKDNFILRELEYYLFNVKYHLVDEYINFNLNNFFSIEYLEKMHLFLFEEIYDEKYCKVKENISKPMEVNFSHPLVCRIKVKNGQTLHMKISWHPSMKHKINSSNR